MRVPAAPSISGLLPTLAAALAVAACSEGVGPDVGRSGVVFGRVTAGSGSPVAGARVDVTAFSGICGSDIFASTSARTDSSGAYVTSVVDFRSRLRRCLEVEAVPPEGSGLRREVVQVPNVSFSGPGLDSVEVSLSLDSASSG